MITVENVMVASSGAVFAATALEMQNGRVVGVAAPLAGRKAHPADCSPPVQRLHPNERDLVVRVPQAALSTSSPCPILRIVEVAA